MDGRVGAVSKALLSKCSQTAVSRKVVLYKRGNAYATMSKVIIGNDGFTVAWLKIKVFQRNRRKQYKHVYSCFLFLLAESP